MGNKRTGGAAFPMPGGPKDGYGNPTNRPQEGMSLRDFFAAQALNGICSHVDTWGLQDDQIVSKAYSLADALIAERDK